VAFISVTHRTIPADSISLLFLCTLASRLFTVPMQYNLSGPFFDVSIPLKYRILFVPLQLMQMLYLFCPQPYQTD
jgi:hypothetical protein